MHQVCCSYVLGTEGRREPSCITGKLRFKTPPEPRYFLTRGGNTTSKSYNTSSESKRAESSATDRQYQIWPLRGSGEL